MDQECNRVLLVDDDPQVLGTLKLQLRREPFDILTAESGEEALQALQENEVAVIVSDYRMPGMNGAEVLSRAMEISPDTVRIMLTGSADFQTVLEAINEAHTSRFLMKPWKLSILREVLRDAITRYNFAVQKERFQQIIQSQNQQLKELNSRVLAETSAQMQLLNSAWRIQADLLIDPAPRGLRGASVSCCTIPAHDLSGDFIFFHQYESTLFDMVVGDVTGKGLSAALQAAALRGEFMREWGRTESLGVERRSPAEIVHAVSIRVLDRLLALPSLISLFFARVDSKARAVTFVDCGSPKPVWLSSAEGSEPVRLLEGEDPPLGLYEAGEDYHDHEAVLAEHDTIVFYSDGVIEAKAPETSELYGIERLRDLLADRRGAPADQVVTTVLSTIRDYTQSIDHLDDFTCVAVKFSEAESPTLQGFQTFDWTREVELVSSHDEIETLHNFLRRVLIECPGVEDDPDFRERVILAVHEGFTNIIRHAYQEMNDLPVWLRARRMAETLEIELLDYGRHFDPGSVPEPDFSEKAEGGFGIYIIRQVASKVTYDHDDKARNRLQISFDLPHAEGE